MKRDNGPKQCLYQGHIVEATLAEKSGGSKDDDHAGLAKQFDAFKEFQAGQLPTPDAKTKCAETSQPSSLTETAMAWHLEAVGSGGVRGTGDKKTMKLAAELYDGRSTASNRRSSQKYTFPRILKEDWPDISKIKYAYGADLLYFTEGLGEVRPGVRRCRSRKNPSGPDAAEAAYASVLCYQNIYQRSTRAAGARRDRQRLPGATKDPKKGATPAARRSSPRRSSPRRPEGDARRLQQVRLLHPASCQRCKGGAGPVRRGEVRPGAHLLRGPALGRGGPRPSATSPSTTRTTRRIYAAQLYLESLNILGTHSEPARPSCFEDMAKDVPKFIESFCTGGKEKEQRGAVRHAQPHPA
jgi:hypothetical protein